LYFVNTIAKFIKGPVGICIVDSLSDY